jgi:hypothetical protein
MNIRGPWYRERGARQMAGTGSSKAKIRQWYACNAVARSRAVPYLDSVTQNLGSYQ